MKEMQTILPYYAYKNLAESKQGFPGNKDFILLLIPALKEITDDEVKYWIGRVQESQIGPLATVRSKSYNAIEISFIREYVQRVEAEKEIERQKVELYVKLKADCMLEPWYKQYSKYSNIENALNAKVQWGLALYFNDIPLANDWEKAFNMAITSLEAAEIREKIRNEKWFTGIDPAHVAVEDMYSKFSSQDFQNAIDYHARMSLTEQMAGNRSEANAHTQLANELTQRKQDLNNKINNLTSKLYKDQLLSSCATNSKPSNAGDITLKGIQIAMKQFEKRMKGKP
jgi:hypothetical protein